MYTIGDIVFILNYRTEIKVTIVRIHLDGTLSVETEDKKVLRIYKDDIIQKVK